MSSRRLSGVVIVILCLFVSLPAVAGRRGLVAVRLPELEASVRETHDLKSIAQRLSELKNFEEWPADVDADLRLYIAIKWLEKHHTQAAYKLLQRIPAGDTDAALWRYFNAIALLELGFPQNATAYLAQLEQDYGRDPDVLYLKSIYLSETNNLKGAIEVLDKLIRQNRRNGKFYLQRGIFNLLVFDHDRAIKDLKKAVKYLPRQALYQRQQALLQTGLIYLKIKLNRKKGMDYIRRGIELDPASELVRQLNQAIR